ncbi:MAG: TolC family protein [Verrucomicrobia bacterium]|nr:MAG: TolC family protein [Verrucomicrobiota bacterium]
MISRSLFVAAFLLAASAASGAAETNRVTSATNWLTRALSLDDCMDLALKQNSAILKGKSDLEAAYGVVVQTRAIAIPKLRATGDYSATDATEKFPGADFTINRDQNWSANVRVVQSIYEGGRIRSALRTAQLTQEQAILEYERVIADSLLDVRVTYYDVLLTTQQVLVQEASVNLLAKELEDTRHRFDAGTVSRFNVLRAEVELANARPRLIRAKNAYRIAKNTLANLLGYNLPRDLWENVPLTLTGKLAAEPYEIDLPAAIGQALEWRPELGVLRKAEGLRKEGVTSAQGGYKPSVQLFAGYGARNSQFSDDLVREISGWQAGAQVSWDIFDGRLTKGKVDQARALHEKSKHELDDTTRRIELEVRTAYSQFIEAKELLESQKKVQEQAEEALRLANARADTGTGTQLDVLSAQTALTDARSTQIQALRDYAVARARLERAIGQTVIRENAIP